MQKMLVDKSKICCSPEQRIEKGIPLDYSGPKAKTAKECGIRDPSYILNNYAYIDPLYRPYHTDYSKSPYKHPGVMDTGYPLVDPYRRRMGWGQIFRSQHEGICPEGFRSSGRNLCIPLEPESWGTFYTTESSTITPLAYSNCKIPYNASMCDPCKYKTGPWSETSVCSDKIQLKNNQDLTILGANGYDDEQRVRQGNCFTKNFW